MSKHSFAAIVYALAFVITYGHGYHSQPETRTSFDGRTFHVEEDMRALVAFLIAMAWPLYWSQELWRDTAAHQATKEPSK